MVIITSAFITLWLLIMEVVLFLQCQPIQAWWYAADGTCVDQFAFAYFTNITSLVADLWIFAMPIPVILKLNTDSHKKVVLCFLFSVGLGTCAISASRLAYILSDISSDITCEYFSYSCLQTKFSPKKILIDYFPLPGSSGLICILSVWEPCASILCANLPMVFSVFVRIYRPPVAQNGDSKTTDQSRRGSNRSWMRLNSTATSVQVLTWYEKTMIYRFPNS